MPSPLAKPPPRRTLVGALVAFAALLACTGSVPPAASPPPTAPPPPPEPAFVEDEAGEGGPGAYTGPTPAPSTMPWIVVTPTDPIMQLDGGYLHMCALTERGVIRCWGDSNRGLAHDAAGVWAEVRAGMYQTCGRAASGIVTCWGTVGPNNESPSDPGVVDGLPPLKTFDLSEGAICGLDDAGGLHCVGNGRVADDAPEGTFVSLSVGFDHGCALRQDGTLACWGDGSNPDGEPPFQAVPPPWPVTAVAAGLGYHTCALREDATIGCWGGDGGGDGGTVYAGNLRAPPGAFASIAAGYVHTCALKADGTVHCWGEHASPPSTLRFRSITSGDEGTCGILTDGNLACWGSDQSGIVSQTPGTLVSRGGPP